MGWDPAARTVARAVLRCRRHAAEPSDRPHLVLVAAVRRIRDHGCKFDHVMMWESPEGFNKSSAIRILAGGAENFSDQTILGVDDRKQQELTKGVWFYEIAEMSE